MLGFRDNLTLAFTKLKTRRIRLIITLFVSGLLFSVLIIVSLVIRGLVGSLTDFTKEGFLNHFIVYSYNGNYLAKQSTNNNTAVLDRATAIFSDIVAKKTAEAKRLGVSYDAATEEKPYLEYREGGKVSKSLNPQNPAARQALRETVDLTTADAHLKTIANEFHATGVYKSFVYSGSTISDYNLAPIINGKERSVSNTNGYGPPDPIDAFSQSLTTYDEAMMKPFLFQNTELTAKAGEPIPILAPINAAEILLSLKDPTVTASTKTQLDHLALVRQKAANLVFSVCYRNSAALDKLSQAQKQAEDIAAHKSDAGFKMPSVVYTVPSQPCTAPVISQDTRTVQERQADDKLTTFNEEFGQKPIVQTIPFRIVGLLPRTMSMDTAVSFQAALTSLLSTNLNGGWIMSHQAADANPLLAPIQNDPVTAIFNSSANARYVEFANHNDEKSFIAKYNCQPSQNHTCSNVEDVFLSAYGNPLTGLYEAGDGLKTTLTTMLIIIAALSALIMMGTIGKVVADSRKETSVFRALGASRTAIDQIYFLYSIILGILTFATAAIIGLLVAAIIDGYTVGQLSTAAVLAFNAKDLHKQFHLIGWSLPDIASIAGLIIITSLASALPPILTNVRRDPVKDMREE